MKLTWWEYEQLTDHLSTRPDIWTKVNERMWSRNHSHDDETYQSRPSHAGATVTLYAVAWDDAAHIERGYMQGGLEPLKVPPPTTAAGSCGIASAGGM